MIHEGVLYVDFRFNVLNTLFSAQQVFWHSTAHILGEALERVYGGCLCYGPPIENGFYYDMHLENNQVYNDHTMMVLNSIDQK